MRHAESTVGAKFWCGDPLLLTGCHGRDVRIGSPVTPGGIYLAAGADRDRRAATLRDGLYARRLFICRYRPGRPSSRPSDGKTLVLKGANYGAKGSSLVRPTVRGAVVGGRSDCKRPMLQLAHSEK